MTQQWHFLAFISGKWEHIHPETCPWMFTAALFVISKAAAAKSLQSCPTLCDPIDGSPPGSAVPGILQARTLEWVAFSFSNAWTWKVKVKSLSCDLLLATPWTAATDVPQWVHGKWNVAPACHGILLPWKGTTVDNSYDLDVPKRNHAQWGGGTNLSRYYCVYRKQY